MDDLFGVFKGSIDTFATDQKAMMEKLAEQKAAGEALGDYLQTINDGLSDML